MLLSISLTLKHHYCSRRNATSALPETFMDELVTPIKAIRTALGSSMEVACDWHHRDTAPAPPPLPPGPI